MLQFPEAPEPKELRLLVLWDVDAAYGLTSLALALPRVGGNEPEVYWSIPIPVAEMLASVNAQANASATADDADIPMSVKEDDALNKESGSDSDD